MFGYMLKIGFMVANFDMKYQRVRWFFGQVLLLHRKHVGNYTLPMHVFRAKKSSHSLAKRQKQKGGYGEN